MLVSREGISWFSGSAPASQFELSLGLLHFGLKFSQFGRVDLGGGQLVFETLQLFIQLADFLILRQKLEPDRGSHHQDDQTGEDGDPLPQEKLFDLFQERTAGFWDGQFFRAHFFFAPACSGPWVSAFFNGFFSQVDLKTLEGGLLHFHLFQGLEADRREQTAAFQPDHEIRHGLVVHGNTVDGDRLGLGFH